MRPVTSFQTLLSSSPVALSFAREGVSVGVYDIDEEAIATLKSQLNGTATRTR